MVFRYTAHKQTKKTNKQMTKLACAIKWAITQTLHSYLHSYELSSYKKLDNSLLTFNITLIRLCKRTATVEGKGKEREI